MKDPYRKPGERAPIEPHLRRWFTKSDDVVKGPFDLDAIRRSLRDGYVKSSTLVRAEDATEWRPLSEVKDITLGVAKPAPASAPAEGGERTKRVAWISGAAVLGVVVLLGTLVARSKRAPAVEPVGSASPASLLTRSGDPTSSLPKSFAGIRFGSALEEVSRKCLASGHTLENIVEHSGDNIDARCEVVPVAEPGIEGDFVTVGLCRGTVCEISIHIDHQAAARYREAIATITAKYGRPSEVVSTPPASEEAAERICAGSTKISSATWNWSDGVMGRIDVELHCLDKRPWAWVSISDPDGTARYRDVDAAW